jgi:hypothetical protein
MSTISVVLIVQILIAIPTTNIFGQDKEGLVIDSVPQGATIHIEGEVIGKTPCWLPYKLSGRYRVRAEMRGYDTLSRLTDFGEKRNSLRLTLQPKGRLKAVRRSLMFSGWGQLYSERKFKGGVFLALQITSLLSLGISHLYYTDCLDDYNHELTRYGRLSKSYTSEPSAWEDVSAAYSRLDEAYDYRRIFIYSSIAVYLLNVLDSLFFFPDDLRQFEIIGITTPDAAGSNTGVNFLLSYSKPIN